MNSNPGNETTAAELVNVFNANPFARALAVASNPVGNPATKIGLAATVINYSPLILGGANDVVVEPGYVGIGDSLREVIFRFADSLPDDFYRVDISGTGTAPLRSENGLRWATRPTTAKITGRICAEVRTRPGGPSSRRRTATHLAVHQRSAGPSDDANRSLL